MVKKQTGLQEHRKGFFNEMMHPSCFDSGYTEGAYNMIQSTEPQTLGCALNDSPVGLASWIIEKFYSWSDTKCNIENNFAKMSLSPT